MNRVKRLTAGVSLFILVSLPAQSHQAWVFPNFFEAPQAPVWLSFDVTWGDHLFVAGQAGSGLNELRVVGYDGHDITLANRFVGKTKIVGEVQLTREGTYRVEASAPATYWSRIVTSEGEKWLRKSKDQVRGSEIARADLYWSKAVVFVTVGKPSDVARRSGEDPLELELLEHPNQLTAGMIIKLRALSQGEAVSGQEIKVFAEAADSHKPMLAGMSDKQGLCELKLDEPGRYLLVAQQETTVKDDPKADIFSYNFYLLINVGSVQ